MKGVVVMAVPANNYIVIEQQYFVSSPESVKIGPAMLPIDEVEFLAFDYFKLNQRLVKRFYISTAKRRFFISEKCYNELLEGKYKTVKLGVKNERSKARVSKPAGSKASPVNGNGPNNS